MANLFAVPTVPQSVNFFQQSPETAVDMNTLQRQRLMAQLLAQKGQEGPQGQMVGGHFVAPGALSYVNQLASALGGAALTKDADTREASLAQALLAKRQQDAADFMKAANGTPAQAGRDIQPATPNDDEGNPMPVARVDATPAVPGDMNRALAIALQSQNPQLAAMAPEIMKRQLDAAELQSALQAAGISTPGTGGGVGGVSAPSPGGVGVPPAGTAPQGIPPGISPQAVALTLSRNAQANKLGTMVQDAYKPQTLTEGGAIGRYRPDGTWAPDYIAPKTEPGIGVSPVQGQPGAFQANPVQGYGAAKAGISGQVAEAEAKGRAGQEMQTIEVNGVPVTKTRAQWAAQLNGSQPTPTGGPANGVSIPNPMAPRPGDADRGMIYAQELQAAHQRLQQAQTSNDPAQVARAQQDVQELLKEIKSNKIQLPASLQSSPNATSPAGGGIVGQTGEQKKFGESVASGSAEALLQGRDKAKSAADSILSTRAAREAANNGVFQGSGAEAKLAIAKFINSNVPGITLDPEKVGNTDYMKSILGEGMLAQAKTLGANPSNADAQRITDIVGSIGKDPQAMAKLLDWREEMATRTIQNHNATVKDAEGRGLSSPYDLTVKVPEPRKAASGKVNIEDLLKKYR